MKKYAFILCLVLVGLIVGVPAHAQKKKKNTEDKDNKENQDTKGNKDAKEVDPWKLLYEESKQKVNVLEQSVNDWEKRCTTLEQDTAVLRRQLEKDIANLRLQHHKDLEVLRQQYEKELMTLRQQRMKDSTDLAQIDERLKVLKDIEERWVLQLVADVDDNWVNATCSLANARGKRLDQEIEVSTQYFTATKDKRVEKVLQKLEKVKKNVEVYNRMKELVSKVYDKQAVSQLLPEADALTESKPDDQNLTDLYAQFSSYEIILGMLKSDVVAKVDDEFKKGTTAPYFAFAKSAYDEQKDTIDDILSYDIPWVNKWCKAYFDVLTKGTEGKKKYSDYIKVRNELMDIKL